MKHALILAAALSATLIGGCQTTGVNTQMSSQADPFVSDVIGFEPKFADPAYWTSMPGQNDVIMNKAEIAAFNAENFANEPLLYDLTQIPDSLTRTELTEKLRSISKIPSYPRIYTDGTEVTEADFARYEANLNIAAIRTDNPVRFGMAVQRAWLRTYPTADLLFSHDADNRDIERFQESALFPADMVAVLHESADGQWLLVQSYNYIAWTPKDAIAIGGREEILDYKTRENFLMVTGDKVFTTFNPDVTEVSELQLDMGIKLPLDRPKALAHNLYGQNPYLSHMVLLPLRGADGALSFKHALIARSQDVHIGYLPYTGENIVKQAMKFAGERYGWGHRYNGRDCTGFVSEIYKTFGIKMPRNSGDQGKSQLGQNSRFEKDSSNQPKIDRLRAAKTGDLIYIPGHVLMVLGQSGGQPIAIHDVTGLGYLDANGEYYKGTLNGVSITPVLPMRASKASSYVDKIYNIKSIR